MKKPTLLLSLFLTLLFTTSGCDLLDQDSYQEYIMIESYAYAGLSYPEILITRTMPADVAYSEADAAISQAAVRLSKVGERSEEHTSELQSRGHLVCRLLLEKKKVARAACENETLREHPQRQTAHSTRAMP